MRKCVLHIGMHKTGSTSIQCFLDKYRSCLGDGVVYADLGFLNHSMVFQFGFMKDPGSLALIANMKLSGEEMDKKRFIFRNKIEESLESDFKVIFFSGEGICHLSEDELINLKSKLLEYVDEIVVFAYVRPVVAYMSSAYQQRLKLKCIDISSSLAPNYKNRFSKFETVFGEVTYKIFEAKSLLGGDVVKDFCNNFGLPYYPIESANSSLSLLSIKFLYHIQNNVSLTSNVTPKPGIFTRSLKVIGKEKFYLPSYLVEEVLEKKSSDIAWMNERLGLDNRISEIPYNVVDEMESFDIISLADKEEILGLESDIIFANHVFELTGKRISELVEECFIIKK